MVNFKIYVMIVSLAVFCILQTCADAISKGDKNISTRIVGGNATAIDNVKYIVFLRYRNRFMCGGTLISTTHVVTAAHCVTKRSGAVFTANLVTVHGGSTYKSQDGVVSTVKRIIVPSNFRNRNPLAMDVAILQLASPVTGTNIDTIGLCSNTLPVGAAVTVSGWGQTTVNGLSSDQLRTVNVNMISRQKCIRSYRFQATISTTMICAARSGKDACSGDSGGPLIYNGELCGIVSWGIGCARSAYPGVYTAVNKVKTFIMNAMKE